MRFSFRSDREQEGIVTDRIVLDRASLSSGWHSVCVRALTSFAGRSSEYNLKNQVDLMKLHATLE